MPNIKSAIKRMESSKRKAAYNKAKKTELKTVLKRARIALSDEAGDVDKEQVFRDAQKKLDKAVSRGIIHKNKAGNNKAKLAALMAKSK